MTEPRYVHTSFKFYIRLARNSSATAVFSREPLTRFRILRSLGLAMSSYPFSSAPFPQTPATTPPGVTTMMHPLPPRPPPPPAPQSQPPPVVPPPQAPHPHPQTNPQAQPRVQSQSQPQPQMQQSSGSFLDQIEEIRTPFPLPPNSVEEQRLQMLNKARQTNDLFYVVFHALFCARSVNPNLQLPNLTMAHLHGLDLLTPFLVNNSLLMEQFVVFCSTCPGPINFMLQIFPQYRDALNDVLNFLQLMGEHWQSFEQVMGPRGYPPLKQEFSAIFLLKSRILQHVIFTACCRRLCGGPSDGWLKIYNQIFYRDDAMQASHARLLKTYGLTQQVVRQIETDKAYIKDAYIKVRHRQMIHLSRMSTQTQHARSHSATDPRPPVFAASPDLARRQPIPSPREARSQQPSPSMGGMMQSRNGTPIQVTPLHSQGPIMFPPNSTPTQNPNANALAGATTGPTHLMGPHSVGVSLPTTHNPLAAQQASTPSFPTFSRTSSLGSAVPFGPTTPSSVAGAVHANQTYTPSNYVNDAIGQAQGPNPFAFSSASAPGLEPGPAPESAMTAQPGFSMPRRRPTQQPIPPWQQQQQQQQPLPIPQHSQPPPFQPQPYQLPKIPMFPPPNFTPALFANPNPLLVGLHESHLKRLYRSIGADGNVDDTLSLFQYMHDFAVRPVTLPYLQPSMKWTLVVSVDDFASVPKPLETRDGGRAVYGRADGSRTYHLRCTKMLEAPPQFEEHEWAARETKWPASVFIDVNGEAQQVRHSNHHGKDLPLDITPCIREGANEIRITVLHSPWRHPTAPPPVYVFAVESIVNANMQRAREAASTTLSTRESIAQIDHRLATSQRNDDELSVLDDSITIDLFDPFMARIFNVPARGRHCGHRECFDLQTFLDTRLHRRDNETMPGSWKCPMCSKDCRPTSLLIDGFLSDVKRELESRDMLDSTRVILVRKCGAWEPKGDKAAPSPRPAAATPAPTAAAAAATAATPVAADGAVPSPGTDPTGAMKTESALQNANRSTPTARGPVEVIELD